MRLQIGKLYKTTREMSWGSRVKRRGIVNFKSGTIFLFLGRDNMEDKKKNYEILINRWLPFLGPDGMVHGRYFSSDSVVRELKLVGE